MVAFVGPLGPPAMLFLSSTYKRSPVLNSSEFSLSGLVSPLMMAEFSISKKGGFGCCPVKCNSDYGVQIKWMKVEAHG